MSETNGLSPQQATQGSPPSDGDGRAPYEVPTLTSAGQALTTLLGSGAACQDPSGSPPDLT